MLNGAATLRVVGPVVLNLRGGIALNGSAGAAGQSSWLRLNISSGGLTLNGNATLDGFVVAPTGSVIINGTLNGGVVSDRIIITGGGVLNAGR